MYAGIDARGYIVSTGLASLNILGSFFAIFVGAFVFSNDWQWNTYQHMFINSVHRRKVCLYKLTIIALSAMFVLFLVVVYTSAIFLMGNGTLINVFPEKFALQIIYTYLSLFFWGIFAFAMSALMQNIIIGVLIPFALSNFEMLIYQHIGMKASRMLPSFNIKSLLYYAFDNLKPGSMIIFPDFGYSFNLYSHLYVVFCILAFITVSVIIFSRIEVPS